MNKSNSNEKARGVMSFLLFVFIFLLNVSIFAKSVVNPDFMSKSFGDFDYISGYCDDINCYACDVFERNGLESDGIGDILSFDFCSSLTEKYIGAKLGNNSGFADTTYQNSVDEIKKPIALLVEKEASAITANPDKESVDGIAQSICDYMLSRLEIAGIDKAATAFKAGEVASLVAIAVSGLFTAAFCLITFFIGSTRYRSIRAISIPFSAVGVLDICLSVMAFAVLQVKTIDIYPLYLRGAVMNCLYSGIKGFILYGAGCIIISLVISTVVWKLRRKHN